MDKKEVKEKQLIEWEQVAAEKMKNNFLDVKEIKFNKDGIYANKLTGYTRVNVDIVTEQGKFNIDTSLPYQEDLDAVGSYVGNPPEEGKTIEDVKVIYTNGSEAVLSNDN